MIEGQSREQIDRGRIRRLETSKESRRTSEARKRFTIQRIPVPEIVILPKHRSKNSRKSRRIKRRPVFCNNKRPRRGERRNGKLLSRPTCRGVLPLTVVYLEQLLSPFLSLKKKGKKRKRKSIEISFWDYLIVSSVSILSREIVQASHSERSKLQTLHSPSYPSLSRFDLSRYFFSRYIYLEIRARKSQTSVSKKYRKKF